MANTIEPNSDTLFVNGSLDELLPRDSECRIIMQYLNEVDFEIFLKRYKNDSTGRPNYDPKRLLAVWIWGIKKRILSASMIERLCKTDIEFRWLCGDNAPKKSTLSEFRAKNLTELAGIGSQIQIGLKEIGLIEGKGAVTDGTIMPAASSKRKIRKRENVKKIIKAKKEELIKLMSGEDVDKEEIFDLENEVEKLKTVLEYSEEKGVDKVCLSEPEAHYMLRKDETYGPSYNIQFNIDDVSGAILESHIIEQGNDHGTLKANIEATREKYPEIERACADAAYHKGEDLAILNKEGIYTSVAEPDRKAPGIDDDYQADKFIREKDGYRCPEGHLLNTREKKDKNTYRYYGAPCHGCPEKKRCMPKGDSKSGRSISESIYKDIIELNSQQRKTETGQQQKKARSIFAEGIIMRLKWLLGVDRFNTWGKSHVKSELTLYEIVSNFLLWCGIWAPLCLMQYPVMS